MDVFASMKDDFARELEDEESPMKDVSLICSDGGTLRASKAILAIRSPVFKRMFYGNFRESKEDCKSVKMDYPAPVLRQVVRYCYTNTTEFALMENTNDSDAKLLITAFDAANYLEIKGLQESIKNEIKFPLAIMEGLLAQGVTDGDLWQDCMIMLERDPEYWLGKLTFRKCDSFAEISFLLLETLYDGAEKEIPAFWLVKGLQRWNKANNCMTEEETSKLQKLADAINLQSMGMKELAQVNPCSLFSSDRLYKNLTTLVKEAESSKESGNNRKRSRGSTASGSASHRPTVRGRVTTASYSKSRLNRGRGGG